MNYYIGIDLGTSAMKLLLMDAAGNIHNTITKEYPLEFPQPGWSQQNPEDWITALCKNTKAILEKSGIPSSNIAAVAVDSATHTYLACDKNFKPLRNAVHWTDSRSRKQANFLREQYGEEIFEKTYHKPDTIWTLPQLKWLSENEPEVFSEIGYLFFEKDYIRYYLTDVYCTDVIEAEGSMLFDCNRMEWDSSLCALASISVDMLPPLKKPTDIIGSVTKEAAKKTGLSEGTPVICGTTDTVMEVFASGAVEEGDITVKLATAGRICIISDKPYPDRHIINYSHVVDGLYYPGTATKAAANSYRWYRDTLGKDSFENLNVPAEAVAPGSDGLMFHPYLNGELSPYNDPELKGSYTGISARHTTGHFTRATLEGVAMSLKDCMNVMKDLGVEMTRMRIIGGGAKGKLWRQIVADVLGVSLEKVKVDDSSFGSAMLAAVGIGWFASYAEAAETCIEIDSVTTPIAENVALYEKLFTRYKAIHDALAPIYRN